MTARPTHPPRPVLLTLRIALACGFPAAAVDAAATVAADLPATQPARLVIPDEPDWNLAEDLAAAGKFDAAADRYLKTLRVTTKPWLKARAAARLLDVAPRAARYDAVITAYIALVHLDPAKALAARPALPESDSAYVDAGLAQAGKALAEPGLSADQKQALLGLQLDLYRVRRDAAHADAVLEQLSALLAADAAGPLAIRRFADLKLSTARVALDRGDFARAAEEVRAARTAFTDPQQQEEAIYLLAQAGEGVANRTNDPSALKDAALNYMRVVTYFQDWPENRRVPAAMLRTAAILEKLGAGKQAADLYHQVAIQYTTRPEAKAAADNARRLGIQP